MNLCTVAEAKHHIRIDGDDDDAWLGVMIPAVSEAVRLWLKDEWRAFVLLTDSDGDVVLDSDGVPVVDVDSNGAPTVKPVVKAATLIELAQQYRYRDGKDAGAVAGNGYVLGVGATALLASLRKSTVA